MNPLRTVSRALLGLLPLAAAGRAASPEIVMPTPLAAPAWAILQRQLLAEQVPAYGEPLIEWGEVAGTRHVIGARGFTVKLAPGSGAKLTLAMRRYASVPSMKLPWAHR